MIFLQMEYVLLPSTVTFIKVKTLQNDTTHPFDTANSNANFFNTNPRSWSLHVKYGSKFTQ